MLPLREKGNIIYTNSNTKEKICKHKEIYIYITYIDIYTHKKQIILLLKRKLDVWGVQRCEGDFSLQTLLHFECRTM